MCNAKQLKIGFSQLEERFGVTSDSLNPEFAPDVSISAFDHKLHPIITTANPDVLTTNFRWGLIPPDWKKEPKDIWNNTVNAKLEHLDEKYSWSKITQNRCLIPVTGYYEHHWNDAKGKSKTKFIIHNADVEAFALAGLYSTWISSLGDVYNTYAICTTCGNDTMKFVHNKDAHKDYFRMPVMLNKSDERSWLDTKLDYMDFAYPNYKPKLIAFPYEGEPAPQIALL